MKDHDIIELFFERNEQAIKVTSEKYGASLLRLSENITKNSADAEECVNDAYLTAWNAIPPERPEHFFAWLAAVTRNCSFKLVRSRSRRRHAVEIVELTDELAECVPSRSDVLTELESERLDRVIDGFIRGLDADARFVFMRRYFFSDPIKELSRSTGFSQNKLKSMLHRARKKLRQTLEKEGFSI